MRCVFDAFRFLSNIPISWKLESILAWLIAHYLLLQSETSARLTLPFQRRPLPFPWKQALLSRPFQALIVVQFCQNWGDYLIMTELPTYISTALGYPLDTVSPSDSAVAH